MTRYSVKITRKEALEFTWVLDEITGGYIVSTKMGRYEGLDNSIGFQEKGEKTCEEHECRKYKYTLSDRPLWVAAI